MEDKLYSIPVKEAFEIDCECPICKMYQSIEKSEIEFTMGPSYMEYDVRFQTDEKGFCDRHVSQLYHFNNRLGLALIMNTHLERARKDIGKLSDVKGGGFFKKKDYSELVNYIEKLNNSCFVCDRVNNIFDRYIATIFHLYKNDKEFVKLYEASKGFCTKHYGILVKKAEEFMDVTNKLYMDNMERVNGDVSWFIDKFDYRFKEEPWKNSKDSLPRTIIKTNSIELE